MVRPGADAHGFGGGGRFLKTHGEIGADGKYRGDSAHATWKRYRCALRLLASFCARAGITALTDVATDALEDYRGTRQIGKVAWKVERQMLITFFGFCISRKWASTNPAKDLKPPRNIKPNEVVPYTIQEESLILLLERHHLEAGGGGHRRKDPHRGVQEIGSEGRSCPPVSAHSHHPAAGAGRHFRAGSRHPGEQAGGRPEALRQVIKGPPGEHRPAHDGPFRDRGGYKPSHTPVKRKSGGRKLMTPKGISWCGGGDLNPHGIAPASTSS